MEHFFIFKELVNSNFTNMDKNILHTNPSKDWNIFGFNNYVLSIHNNERSMLSHKYKWFILLDIDYNIKNYNENIEMVDLNLPFQPNLKTITEDQLFYISLLGIDIS